MLENSTSSVNNINIDLDIDNSGHYQYQYRIDLKIRLSMTPATQAPPVIYLRDREQWWRCIGCVNKAWVSKQRCSTRIIF